MEIVIFLRGNLLSVPLHEYLQIMAEENNWVVRSPTREEMTPVLELMNTEGWNVHLSVLHDLYDLQPDSSKVVVDSKGLVLSHCCFVSLDESNILINGVVTRTEYRGRGLARLTWAACMDQHQGKNMFLNSNLLVVPMYQNKGFKLAEPAFDLFVVFVCLKNKFPVNFAEEHQGKSCTVKKYDPAMFQAIDEYDAQFQKIKRSHFLRVHLEKCTKVQVAFKEDVICGYGTLRKTQNGYTVMPLYAEDKTTAELLLFYLVSDLPEGTTIKVQLCDDNKEAVEVMMKIGYEAKPVNPKVSTKRMFTLVNSPITSGTKVYSAMNFQYCLV